MKKVYRIYTISNIWCRSLAFRRLWIFSNVLIIHLLLCLTLQLWVGYF